MNKINLILLLLLLATGALKAQLAFHQDSVLNLRIGASFPTHLQLYLSYQINEKFSTVLEFGKPIPSFNTFAYDIMQYRGLSDQVRQYTEQHYSSGMLLGLALEKQYQSLYWRIALQMTDYKYHQVSADSLADYYSQDISVLNKAPYDTIELIFGFKPQTLAVNFVLGKQILNLRNRLYLNAELSLRGMLFMRHFFSFNRYSIRDEAETIELINALDKGLENSLSSKMWMPTIGVQLVYRLKSCNCN